MTIAELDALELGTPIYLPTNWEVVVMVFDRRVGVTSYYTVTHPPDSEGVVSNKRPVYLHALDLIHATTEMKPAWQTVLAGLNERAAYIINHQLTDAL